MQTAAFVPSPHTLGVGFNALSNSHDPWMERESAKTDITSQR